MRSPGSRSRSGHWCSTDNAFKSFEVYSTSHHQVFTGASAPSPRQDAFLPRSEHEVSFSRTFRDSLKICISHPLIPTPIRNMDFDPVFYAIHEPVQTQEDQSHSPQLLCDLAHEAGEFNDGMERVASLLELIESSKEKLEEVTEGSRAGEPAERRPARQRRRRTRWLATRAVGSGFRRRGKQSALNISTAKSIPTSQVSSPPSLMIKFRLTEPLRTGHRLPARSRPARGRGQKPGDLFDQARDLKKKKRMWFDHSVQTWPSGPC